ncbi:M48 family metalloprotease [Streptomyces sp. NPDC085946]|uniref:M48 family metalloprotease n=1 Tax=Streptomyces sp. NPDC085946 TaxID=3365744 RepID=UPI0037D20E8D
MTASRSAPAGHDAVPGGHGLADTGPRFVLLMTVLTASSVSMLNTVLAPEPDDTPGDALGCLLAAGMDPDGRNLDNLLINLRSPDALAACMSGVPAVQYGKGMVATAVLLAVAALVFRWQPRLRERWRPTVPSEDLDADGSLAAALRELCGRAGVTSGVRFRVDPARTTSGAVVYGRPGAYTVCLHAGLLVRRTTDPEGFRAVVLHELAHVRNRDVVYASASTALWRVFVVLALLPYLWHEGGLLLSGLTGRTDSPFWPGAASRITFSVLTGLLLVCLVHLARADLLRRRELHADARAVSCGALPSAWAHRDPDGAVTTSVRRVTALLRTHPSWAERQRALAEPGRLPGAGAPALLLVGVSGTLLVNTVGEVVPRLSTSEGGAWLATAFLAPVLYVSLARSAATARTRGQTLSGLRAGGWLGCGLVLGEVVRGNRGTDWLGPEPQFLLGLLLTAAVAAAWSAQCAYLALGLAGRGPRHAAGLLNLLVTAVVLWGGLYWWYTTGAYQSMGVYSRAEQFRDLVRQASPGAWGPYARELTAITESLPTLTALDTGVLLPGAALALWLLPLVLRASTAGASGLRLGRTLAAGAAGGLLCWAMLLAVYRVQHGRRPATWAERSGPYGFVHAWLVIAAVLAACVLTAAVVAAVSRRLWLPRALLAVAATQLLAHAAVFVLFSADGCLGPFRVFADRCHWVPSSGRVLVTLVAGNTLAPAVFLGACAAVGGAAVGWAVRRPGRGRAARPGDPAPAPVPAAGSRWRRPAPAGAVLALAVPTLLLFVTARTGDAPSSPAGKVSASDAPGDPVTDLVDAAPRARSEKIRVWQALAWLGHGGLEHSRAIGEAAGDLGDALTAAGEQRPGEDGRVRLDEGRFRRVCGTLAERATDALAYFPVPDRDLQKRWSASLSAVSRHGRTCREAMTPGSGGYRSDAERARAFDTALQKMLDAVGSLMPLLEEIGEVALPASRDPDAG